MIIVKRFFILG